jgi:hypothetical protein
MLRWCWLGTIVEPCLCGNWAKEILNRFTKSASPRPFVWVYRVDRCFWTQIEAHSTYVLKCLLSPDVKVVLNVWLPILFAEDFVCVLFSFWRRPPLIRRSKFGMWRKDLLWNARLLDTRQTFLVFCRWRAVVMFFLLFCCALCRLGFGTAVSVRIQRILSAQAAIKLQNFGMSKLVTFPPRVSWALFLFWLFTDRECECVCAGEVIVDYKGHHKSLTAVALNDSSSWLPAM